MAPLVAYGNWRQVSQQLPFPKVEQPQLSAILVCQDSGAFHRQIGGKWKKSTSWTFPPQRDMSISFTV